ncbi:MAG TPA: ABC transporter permease [Patescibacteria group bacterium]|nr:ABC transporter permease [Patescibacteria group bacterium]
MTLMQDVRYALRQLRKTPTFTLTVLLTLALGIGANTAIFTLVNAVLLARLPVVDPATLIRLGNTNSCCVNSGASQSVNYSLFPTETYYQLKKTVPEFSELAAMQAGYSFRPIIARRDGEAAGARSVMGEFVSGNYFRTFGLTPRAGRLLTDPDDVPGAPMTAVMSYATWQRDYAGDPTVVGSTFWVNTKPVTIVGIAPEGFYGDRMSVEPPDYYLPIESMHAIGNAAYVHEPEVSWLYMIGRVKPGVSLAALQEKVGATVRNSFATTKTFASAKDRALLDRVHVVLTPGGGGIQWMQNEYRSRLYLLMWVSGLVLLIACANIANLLLVRGMGRKAEMSVRTALGASRGRMVRQLLTESVLLATLGGLVGLAVAYAGAHMLLALAFPGARELPVNAGPSAAPLAFAFFISLLTGVLFGVAPAWMAARAEPVDSLRGGARATSGGASLVQRGLVVLQAGLSLVLLVGAGLFSQSLGKLEHSDMKLNANNRYIVHINPQAAGYATTQVEALYRVIEERFHALPGVVHVGLATYTPMEDNNWSNSVQAQGQPNLNKSASFVKVNADYFDSVGTRVVMGRGIIPQDAAGAPTVAVVNRSFVKEFFGNTNPIGRRFGAAKPESTGDFEIVGVVEDTTYTSVQWKDHGMYFVPITQRPASSTEPIENDLSLYAGAMVLETDRPRNDLAKLTQATLAAINPNLTIVKFQTFAGQIADQFTEERLLARLTALFGGLALLLATIGLYGVTADGVERRTPEIGIRMALGAERGGVVRMVLRGAMVHAALGLAIGVPVALVCVQFIKSQLYEISSPGAGILAGAIGTLALATCLAGMIPARRAATIDPVRALRSE